MADTVPLDRLNRQVVIGDDALPGEARVIEAAERALSGERRGVRAVLPFLGPAFIAAVAYVDPGNFATNTAGGSQFGRIRHGGDHRAEHIPARHRVSDPTCLPGTA